MSPAWSQLSRIHIQDNLYFAGRSMNQVFCHFLVSVNRLLIWRPFVHERLKHERLHRCDETAIQSIVFHTNSH